MTQDTPAHVSPLARAYEAAPRRAYCFPVNDILGLGGKPIHAIAVQVARNAETNAAYTAAHKLVAEEAKKAGEGAAAAQADHDILGDAKLIELLFVACREVDQESIDAAPGDPKVWKVKTEKNLPWGWPAFPSPAWMRKNLTTDQIGALYALYIEVRRAEAPDDQGIADDTVEAVHRMCAAHVDDDIPEATLAVFERPKLTHLVVLLSAKLSAARASVETALEELERMQVRAERAEAALAALSLPDPAEQEAGRPDPAAPEAP